MTTKRDFPMEGLPVQTNAAQLVDMAGHAHALVYGDAAAYQTQITNEAFLVDANLTGGGSSGQTLTLPTITATSNTGRTLMIYNVGGEAITLTDLGASVLSGNDACTLRSCYVSGLGGYWLRFDGYKNLEARVTALE
jgi:hypothetical protein